MQIFKLINLSRHSANNISLRDDSVNSFAIGRNNERSHFKAIEEFNKMGHRVLGANGVSLLVGDNGLDFHLLS
jgi:hypothetical protein